MKAVEQRIMLVLSLYDKVRVEMNYIFQLAHCCNLSKFKIHFEIREGINILYVG